MSSITYPQESYFLCLNQTIDDIVPAIVGGLSPFSIFPDLTANTGLVFDPNTAIISGTPTLLNATLIYQVTSDVMPQIFTNISFEIVDCSLTYDQESYTLCLNQPANIPPPTLSGPVLGPLFASISPDLPDGLILNNDGSITGTPTVLSAIDTYIVTIIDDGTMIEYRGTVDITVIFCIGPIPCLAGDTEILTERGYIPISEMRKDDHVITHDAREVNIKKIASTIYRKKLFKIPKNMYGEGVPRKDIVISANHKYFVGGKWLLPKENVKSFKHNEPIRIYHLMLENPTDTMMADGLIVESWGGMNEEYMTLL